MVLRALILLMLLTIFAASLPGCTFSRLYIGTPLDPGSESRLHVGQMKVEVLDRLGPPDRVTMTWGEPVFEYLYRRKLDRELDLSFLQANFDYEQTWRHSDRLVVRFDREGRVLDYGINLQTTPQSD